MTILTLTENLVELLESGRDFSMVNFIYPDGVTKTETQLVLDKYFPTLHESVYPILKDDPQSVVSFMDTHKKIYNIMLDTSRESGSFLMVEHLINELGSLCLVEEENYLYLPLLEEKVGMFSSHMVAFVTSCKLGALGIKVDCLSHPKEAY